MHTLQATPSSGISHIVIFGYPINQIRRILEERHADIPHRSCAGSPKRPCTSSTSQGGRSPLTERAAECPTCCTATQSEASASTVSGAESVARPESWDLLSAGPLSSDPISYGAMAPRSDSESSAASSAARWPSADSVLDSGDSDHGGLAQPLTSGEASFACQRDAPSECPRAQQVFGGLLREGCVPLPSLRD